MGVVNPPRTPVMSAPPAQGAQPGAAPAIPPASPTPQVDEVSRIEQVLAQPAIQAALMQFGANMLQPPGFGDTFGGRLGQAMGAAGQAAGRVQANQQQQQAEMARQDIARREVGAREVTARATARQADTARDRNQIMRDELQAQIAENIRASERFGSEMGLRRRGQNVELWNAMMRNNAARAQALIEQSALMEPEQAAAALEQAAQLAAPLPFDLVMAEIEGEGRTQRTANALMAQAAAAGNIDAMAEALEGFGWTKAQTALAARAARQSVAQQAYQPIPEPVRPEGGLNAGTTTPPPAAATPPGAAGPPNRPNPQAEAQQAVRKMQALPPDSVTREQFAAIQNNPIERRAAQRIWGMDVYGQLSAKFSGSPRGAGRGMFSRPE